MLAPQGICRLQKRAASEPDKSANLLQFVAVWRTTEGARD